MAQPFSIQAPEQIAKEYMGNKAKIAEAAQMGVLDPTAAVLAGMFIDRMRSAQAAEGAQQPSIAQQVLAPTPAPAPAAAPMGLGATPPAMGMASPMEAPAPEIPAMADGGLVGLYVPDAMFEEPDGGGYAGGGLVAFAGAGAVKAPKPTSYIDEILALRNQMLDKMLPEEEQALRDKRRMQYEEQASDETYEKSRKDAMWETLAEFGFNMANSTAPGLLGSISQAAAAALPGARASKKERKELRERALDKLVEMGAQDREVAKQALEAGTSVWKAGKEAEESDKRMAFEREKLAAEIRENALNRGTQLTAARIGAAPKRDADLQFLAERYLAEGRAKTMSAALDMAYKTIAAGKGSYASPTIPGFVGPNAAQTSDRVRLAPM